MFGFTEWCPCNVRLVKTHVNIGVVVRLTSIFRIFCEF